MPRVVPAALSLLLLAACGGTGAATSTAPRPTPASAERTSADGADVGIAWCDSPAGFSVAHPADWSTNPGTTLPACSWFGPEPFSVPRGTDVRIAAISLRLQTDVDLSTVWPDETARTTVDVAGRSGVRVEQVTAPGLYPRGTRITTYLVDLDLGPDGTVLVADTVGLPGFDHDRDVDVLDAMIASLVLRGTARV